MLLTVNLSCLSVLWQTVKPMDNLVPRALETLLRRILNEQFTSSVFYEIASLTKSGPGCLFSKKHPGDEVESEFPLPTTILNLVLFLVE